VHRCTPVAPPKRKRRLSRRSSSASVSSIFSLRRRKPSYACKSIIKTRLLKNYSADLDEDEETLLSQPVQQRYNQYYMQAIRREIDCLKQLSMTYSCEFGKDQLGRNSKTTNESSSRSIRNWSRRSSSRSSNSSNLHEEEDEWQYILQLHHVLEDARYIHMITEYCPNSMDLYDFLHANNHPQHSSAESLAQPEHLATRIIQQVLHALSYCHDRGIAHRDIKPENILIKSKPKLQIKLIDFGLARPFSEDQRMKSSVGTVYYVAPEVLAGHANYDEKCDVWSTGVILFLLLTGRLPFFADTESQTLKLVQRGQLDFDASTTTPASQQCTRSLLRVDATQRPSARQALHHEWITASANRSNSSTMRLSGLFRRLSQKKGYRGCLGNPSQDTEESMVDV